MSSPPVRLSTLLVLALLFTAPATSEVTFWRDQLSEIPLPAPPENEADPALRAAFDALTRQRLPEAIGSFEQYFARGGNTAYARASFARALFQAGRRAEALEQAEAAVVLAPGEANYALLRSEILHQSGNDAAAIDYLRSAVFAYNADPSLEFQLAELLYTAEQYEEARFHYMQTIFYADRGGSSASSFKSVAYLRVGRVFLRDGNLEEAGRFYDLYVGENPYGFQARFIRAVHVNIPLGRYERARSDLEQLARAPESELGEQGIPYRQVLYYLNQMRFVFRSVDLPASLALAAQAPEGLAPLERAIGHATRQEDQEAVRLLTSILRADRLDFVAWRVLFFVLARSGEPEIRARALYEATDHALGNARFEIARDFLEALDGLKDTNPDVSISRTALAEARVRLYEGLGQYNRAALSIALAEQSAQSEGLGQNAELANALRLLRASIFSRESVGRLESARRACAGILGASGDQAARSYWVCGHVEMAAGDGDAALAHFNAGIEQAPNSPLGYFYRALAHEARRDRESMFGGLEQALEHDSGLAPALNYYGYELSQENRDLDRALDMIRRAVEQDFINGHYLDSLGWVYFLKQDLPRAEYFLQAASMLLRDAGEEEPVVLDHLGDVQRALGRELDARRSYDQALRLLGERLASGNSRPERLVHLDRELRESLRAKISELN